MTINAPAAVTKSASTLTFTSCGAANSQAVTFSSATAATYPVSHAASDAVGEYNVSPANFTLKVEAPAAVTPTNSAPVIGTPALDAEGNEGDTLGSSGSFTDADGNSTLTIRQVRGEGTVTDNKDGSFSWSHTPTDNGGGTVVVEASDRLRTATQSFEWTALNVAPVIGTVTATRTGACSVSVGAPFFDQGSDDTHETVIDWGDSTTTTSGATRR